MDNDGNKVVWTVVIISAIAIIGLMFINFMPSQTSNIKTAIGNELSSFGNSTKSDNSSSNPTVGTNLLTNTGDLSANWELGVGGLSGVTVDTSQKPAVLHCHKTTMLTQTYNVIALQQLNDGLLQPSTTYTASFYAKGTGTMVFYCFPYVPNIAYWSDTRTTINLTNDYKLYTITFTTNPHISGDKYFLLRQDYSTSATDQNTVEAYVYGLKLEKGSNATPWRPNPADHIVSD